jgi:hypothetical protein
MKREKQRARLGTCVRRWLAAVTVAALAAGLCACGGAGSTVTKTVNGPDPDDVATTVTAPVPAPLDTKADADKDNDIGAAEDDSNNSQAFDFGNAASPSERRAIAALVKRYYDAALAENGARGCALIYSTLAEAAPEDDSREPGTPTYMHGLSTCPQVLTALFKHFHSQLTLELPKLRVTRVRLEEHHGWVFLSFGGLPERRISVQREGHVWKMSQIYDQELP